MMVLSLSLLTATQAPAGSIFREVYTGLDNSGIAGTSVSSLTSDPSFPNSPDATLSSELVQDTFEFPSLFVSNYGDQSEGFLSAPQTGNYVFWIASDDDSQLLLSTDANPAHAVVIASVTGYTGKDQWNKYSSQQSVPISLVQGSSYYLKVLHKQGGGGDNLAIGWQKPDGTLEKPMATLYYEPYSTTNTLPIITQSPQDASVLDGQLVSFSVDVAPAAQPLTYQWYRGASPIPGANLPGLTFRASLADNSMGYSVHVGSATSTAATLSVSPTTAPASVVSAYTLGYDNLVQITYSEQVTPQSATNLANYGLSGGISVQKATLDASGTVVTLFTSHFNVQNSYTLTISGVSDYATSPNLLNTTVQVGAVPGLITRKYFLNLSGTAVANLTNSPAYPNNYDILEYTNLFEGRINWATTYGSLLQGWVVPDTTGDYSFAISSDDNSALYLSTDANPANLRATPIAFVSNYTASRTYNTLAGQQTTTPIHLIANQKYYIQALQKQDSGNDNLAVAWQLGGGSIGDGTAPIDGQSLIPWYDANVPLAFTNQPANLTVLQSRPVTLSIGVKGVPIYTGIQWFRNGNPIAGANGLTYSVPHAALLDNNANFYAVVSNLAYTIQSTTAQLTVLTDTVPPQVTLVTTAVGANVQVAYNEFVDPATATNLSNYAISGITFTNAILQGDGMTVVLGLTGSLPANFTISISNVKDWAGNTISPNPSVVTGYTTGLAPGMISYWPMNLVQGTKTPDIISGYDLTLQNMTATNLVAGKYGNSLYFSTSDKSLLIHTFTTNDALPIYKYPNFTVSAWVNGPVQTDHRIYAESSTLGNNNPMFSLGTDTTGATGNFDTYIRNNSNTTDGNHHQHGIVLDNTWHHFCFVMQSNTTPKALVYIDGKLSSANPAPIWPLSVNNLTIGAIVRSSAAAWYTGLIDDVAVWNRSLAADEVQFLFNKGTPVPPPKPLPLTINSFKSDLPAIVQGDSVTLRWDVTKDATSVQLLPVGDVTAYTAVGVGSYTVNPAYSTTYTLIVQRSGQSVTNTLNVAVIGGVASGWTLLDNFDRYNTGPLPAPWSYSGGTTVVNVNGNRMLKTGGGGDSLASLPLGGLSVLEGQQATLFARFWLAQAMPAGAVFQMLGLTDRGIRFWSDMNPDFGPDVIFQNPNGDLQVGTRNGYQAPIELATFSLQPQTAYNIWIDVTNVPFATGPDIFSIYIAQEGSATRTLLFQDYASDRNQNDTGVLGPTGSKLIYLQAGGNDANALVYLDDFYLSKTGLNTTVPLPFGPTTPLTSTPITLTANLVGNQIVVHYASGTLQSAASPAGPWTNVTGANPPAYTGPLTGTQLFFRCKQ